MTIINRLSDRTLRRLAWVATCFLPAAVAVGVPISLAESPSESSWGGGLVGELSFLLVVLSFPVVGLLILRKQPRNTIGWILEAVGLLWGLSVAMDDYMTYGLVVHPGALPGADLVAGAGAGSWAPGIGVMGTFLVLLYPDGHLPSRRWRPVAWTAALSIVVVTVAAAVSPGKLDESPIPSMENPLAVPAAAAPFVLAAIVVFLPLLPVCIAASALALVLRFRRSEGVERLQLKWLASAGGVVAVLYAAAMAAGFATVALPFAEGDGRWVGAVQTMSVLSFALIPAAIGVAVLRHGLYGIDTVINRTLVYGLLTVTLAATYIGSVLLLQQVLNPLTQDSQLAVAASTLAVAALFRPVRRSIQNGVDRRFYRRKYDAARTLDDFAVRLRHELDLDEVGADLCAAADAAVQPAHVSLWLRT